MLGHSASMSQEFAHIIETVDKYYSRDEQELMIH